VAYADELIKQLASYGGAPVNVSKWMNFYSADVMGDLVFGRSFNALISRTSHFALNIIHESGKVLGTAGVIPWFLYLLSKVPQSLSPLEKLIQFSEQCFTERKNMKIAEADVMSHLLAADRFFDDPVEEHQLLVGESRVLIVAGSDTTAAALTYTLYHIARDESLAQKMRAELKDNGLGNASVGNLTELQSLPYLNAVINESMRLHPPTPGGVFRDTPPEGLTVGNHFIPGNVTIITPTYTIQRCKSKGPSRFSARTAFLTCMQCPELLLNLTLLSPNAGRHGQN
jgi:cytochrome P450 family 628